MRGVFYLLLAILILGVGSTISDELEGFKRSVGDDFYSLIVNGLAVLIFRFLIVFAQDPRGKKRELRPGALRTALKFSA